MDVRLLRKIFIRPIRNFCVIMSCEREEKAQTAPIQKSKNAQI